MSEVATFDHGTGQWYAGKFFLGGYGAFYSDAWGNYDIECLHVHPTMIEARECCARLQSDATYRERVRSAYWAHRERSQAEWDISAADASAATVDRSSTDQAQRSGASPKDFLSSGKSGT